MLVDRYNNRVKREDRRAGGIIAAEYNRNRTSETDPMFEWWDFFTEWKEEPDDQSEEELFARLQAWAKATEGLSQ